MKTTQQRPHTWSIGPDPVLHRKFQVWGQARNQARWRGEAWDLSLEDFVEVWGDSWHLRGRSRGSMCMTRRDDTQAWTRDNVMLVTREDHAQRQADGRTRARQQRQSN